MRGLYINCHHVAGFICRSLFAVIPWGLCQHGSKNTLGVIPQLDRGIQLKILIKLVFFIIFWIPRILIFLVVFLDPVVKPRDDRGEE
ncbi:MAG: palindromic element RPE4 domain-containing protein [Janthinobacterium lividum]